MSDAPSRVPRKAPRFFGLPDADEESEARSSTAAPTPLAPPHVERGTATEPVEGLVGDVVGDTPPVPVAAPDADPQATATAELLVDPVARREVGAIVEARHLLADARALLLRQRGGGPGSSPTPATEDVDGEAPGGAEDQAGGQTGDRARE